MFNLFKKKRPPAPTLAKFVENPIISPQPHGGWEAWQTFNPGVICININTRQV